MTEKTRIKDIAALANVSVGTVDRVLHNRGDVSQKTRELIISIVEKTGYKPNIIARSLVTKKSKEIVVIIPGNDPSNPYWAMPLKGIQKAADEIRDFNAKVRIENFSLSNPDSFKNVLDKYHDQPIDGVLICPTFVNIAGYYIKHWRQHGIPVSLIDTNIQNIPVSDYFGQDAVISGQTAGQLMEYMLPENSEVLVVKLAGKNSVNDHIQLREQGFCRYFQQKEPTKNLHIQSIQADIMQTNEPGKTLENKLTSNTRGIFVPNSRVFMVAEYLHKIYKRNIVLLGYDLVGENITYMQNGLINFLIGQQPVEQGYQGIMAVFNKMNGRNFSDDRGAFPIDIIIRENMNYFLNK